MVRNITGLLVDIGLGRFGLGAADMKRLMELKDRSRILSQCAPVEGLYLRDVHYEDGRLTARQRSLLSQMHANIVLPSS